MEQEECMGVKIKLNLSNKLCAILILIYFVFHETKLFWEKMIETILALCCVYVPTLLISTIWDKKFKQKDPAYLHI